MLQLYSRPRGVDYDQMNKIPDSYKNRVVSKFRGYIPGNAWLTRPPV